MLVYWIPKTENTLPANASHRVGVGAIVFNENREVLVVQEKTGCFQGTGIWKIPSGIVEQVHNHINYSLRSRIHSSYARPFPFDLQKQEQEITHTVQFKLSTSIQDDLTHTNPISQAQDLAALDWDRPKQLADR
ncbi:hypothetical protein SLEP1_g29638 [Rubroshorea leprosula]|uniref:Nudix hydrolase domain-containing protein n=1 Tax=Rubroshorea leprosula TaxID=152421 RepID=A0AAV5K011_9ROSI|nr:hypothetical protein SLEP1_g29638 [Rubroshorea leprosula]